MLTRVLLVGASLGAMMPVAQAAPIVAVSLFSPFAAASVFSPSIVASLFSPQPTTGSLVTSVSLAGITGPSQSTIVGSGYTVSFSGVASNEGVVQNSAVNLNAVPVGGVTSGGAAEYLTGDYGSPLTTNIAASGNYLSVGAGAAQITITFAVPQTSLALLWGSIDTTNLLTLSNGDTVTGAQVQAAAAGFAANGYQGPAGSAYVALTDAPFTSVTLTSGTISFEAAGIVASNAPFSVPEPISLAILGGSLAGLGLINRVRRG